MGTATYPFEDALVFLKDGERVARSSWPADVFIEVRERVLVIVSPGNASGSPYEPAQTDLLADNWVML